ncbi:MAG: hypothetical protein ACYCOU_06370 [Sulfobacillus sp.]
MSSDSSVVSLSASLVPHLIGKGGKAIRALLQSVLPQGTSGKITVNNVGDDVALAAIDVPAEHIAAVRAAVERRVAALSRVSFTLPCPERLVGRVLGQGACHLHELTDELCPDNLVGISLKFLSGESCIRVTCPAEVEDDCRDRLSQRIEELLRQFPERREAQVECPGKLARDIINNRANFLCEGVHPSLRVQDKRVLLSDTDADGLQRMVDKLRTFIRVYGA